MSLSQRSYVPWRGGRGTGRSGGRQVELSLGLAHRGRGHPQIHLCTCVCMCVCVRVSVCVHASCVKKGAHVHK